jgi:uracil-DNA glycosylase family 4
MGFYFEFPQKITKSKQAVYDCEKCKLYDNPKLITPKFPMVKGEQYQGLVIVADSPSKEDDIKGIPLSNDKVTIVRSIAFRNKINISNHGAVLFAHRCFKGKRKDTSYRCCRDLLAKDLIDLKPKVIVTLGEMAFKSVMGLKNKVGATLVRNRVIPNYEFNALVFPLLNPNDYTSYEYTYAIQKDLERLWALWKDQYHKRTVVDKVLKDRKILEGASITEVKSESEMVDLFEYLNEAKEVALDYETTNLNPYDDLFEIVTMQFGIAKDAWVLHEDLWLGNESIWNQICEFMSDWLTNPDILKIIQNAKFEDLCSRYVFGVKKIVNTFCTMLATHVIDERPGTKSLDFQNLVRFGIPPYDDTIKSFLKPKEKDIVVNTIRKAKKEDLIQYGGLDVITTYFNYKVLHDILLPNAYPEAMNNYKFLAKGHWAFANMSQRGTCVSSERFDNVYTTLKTELDTIIEKIIQIPEVIEYENYLEEQLGIKNSDKPLKQLLVKTKRPPKRIKLR